MEIKIKCINTLLRVLGHLKFYPVFVRNKMQNFLSSLIAVFLTPQELIEFNKRCYSGQRKIKIFGTEKIRGGLYTIEREFIKKYDVNTSRCLVLGCGGGREIIYLAKRGFNVVGIDFIEKMIDQARSNILSESLEGHLIVGDFMKPFFKASSFDCAFLSSSIYCSIPTQKLRVAFLREVKKILKNDAKFYLTFSCMSKSDREKLFILRKVIALACFGNFRYQKGDRILRGEEFHHLFPSKEEFIREAKMADFQVDGILRDEIGNFFAAFLLN